MGRFFKKLFKASNKNAFNNEDMQMMNSLVNEIMAEESLGTNKLPEIPQNTKAEALKGFSSYKFYSCSHIGRVKKSNQDSIFTGELKCYTNGEAMNIALGIVADGMGGLSMGELASATAISSASNFLYARITEYFEQGLPAADTILTHISNAIQNANAIVKDKGNEIGEDIGTTFTLALLIGNAAYFGHVGDSRAYIIDTSAGSIEKVTRDHSLVGRMIELGQLTEKEAKSHPRRNEIYRMLGLRDAVEADTFCRVINKNSIIALVSDGLWELVDDSEILKEIKSSKDLTHTAEKLIQMANDNGGCDNISVVLVKPE